ncbi:MAG TPA: hypothetical protein VK281_07710 [Xanthobacteraceae bacterium]|nr:hypothetical protein [Xanthobacteraceae bacterium]
MGDDAEVMRPEHAVRIEPEIELIQPTGSRSYATFRIAGQQMLAELQAHDVGGPGERIPIDINLWPRRRLRPAHRQGL